MWQKLTLFSLLLLIVNLLVFTVFGWQSLIAGADGYNIIMTSVFGRTEKVLDIIVLTTSVVLGIVSASWLFKFIYF